MSQMRILMDYYWQKNEPKRVAYEKAMQEAAKVIREALAANAKYGP